MRSLRVLGSLDLRGFDGEAVHSVLSQPKRSALLAYLAVGRPRGFHRRDTLLGLFWPESGDAHARAALSTALSFLRRSLGDGILVTRGTEEVGLDLEAIQADVWTFEEALKADDPAEALEAYRGDLLAGFFLSGCPEFEQWLEVERQRLSREAAGAAWAVAMSRIGEGELPAAELYGYRALTVGGVDESRVRQFLEALAGAGDRAAALRFYERFAEALGQGLDVRPNEETRKLVEDIRASVEVRAPGAPPAPPRPQSVEGAPVLDRLRTALADQYFVEREIGKGGMATVYLAHDVKHDRKVAIKVLDPDLAATVGAERFLREIKTAAHLTHPHILPLHDSGEADGFLFYVMPFVKGESLRARLKKEIQLPVGEAVQIARVIADALAYAHREGVIHRDVKPANIMLEEGHAVLADFGVTQATAPADDVRLTSTGVSLGSPAYMSPEQAAGKPDLDGRSDQYALACVLYEMLAGQPPFTGVSAEGVVRQHLVTEATRITEIRPTVPEQVEAALEKALSKAPADRFATIGEFGKVLEAQLHAPPFGTAPTSHRGNQVRWRWGAVGLVIAVSVVSLFTWRPWSGDRGETAGGPAIQGTTLAELGTPTPENAERPSIAVLPFQNRSGLAEDAYFADGMCDQVITKLAMISGLSVRGLTSVLTYRNSRKNLRQIGEELDAHYILEGSVQRAGERVRINVQLIQAATDEHVWASTYDRPLSVENVLAIQSEIVQAVTDSIRAVLEPDERARIQSVPTASLDAYELYLLGRNRWSNRSAEASREAIRYYEAAIELDSTFALAYSGLADAHIGLPIYDLNVEPAQVYERTKDALNRAHALDPSAGEVHASLGMVSFHELNWEAAVDHLSKAVDLSPGYPNAHFWYGMVLSAIGRTGEGVAELEEALALDPRSNIMVWASADRLYQAGRIEEARARYERAIKMDPPIPWAYHNYAWTLLLDEPTDLAGGRAMLVEFAKLLGHPRPERLAPVAEAAVARNPERSRAAEGVLDDLVEATGFGRDEFLFWYCAAAPLDRCFAALDEAVFLRHPFVGFVPITFQTSLPEVRRDPRWERFLTRIRYPG